MRPGQAICHPAALAVTRALPYELTSTFRIGRRPAGAGLWIVTLAERSLQGPHEVAARSPRNEVATDAC